MMIKTPVSAFDNILERKYLPVSFLIIISAALYFPFVLKGFGDFDAVGLAISIIDFINHGKVNPSLTYYYVDVVPLYVIYIKLLMKFLGYDYAYLPAVMNYSNAVFGTLMVIPAYLFVQRLCNINSIAFYAVLTFIFAPTVFQNSIFGFPALLALFFFITSLYFFLLWLDHTKHVWLLLSFVAFTASLLFKSDFILGGGAYVGLLYMKGEKNKEKIILTCLFVILSLVSFLVLRRWLIGVYDGYTTSPYNFLKWARRCLRMLVYNGFHKAITYQFSPTVYGIGFLNFFMAAIVFVFYLTKRRYDIIIFILSWTAVSTLLWWFMCNNIARHNLISVLPFIIMLLLFFHEKAPRLMAIFPVMLIAGNFLLTAPSASTQHPSGSLFKSQELLDKQQSALHLAAKKVVRLAGDKVVATSPDFKRHLIYELLSSGYEFKNMIGRKCRVFVNTHNTCMVCAKFESWDFIKAQLAGLHLEDPTIISTVENIEFLKKEGFHIISKREFESWSHAQ